MRALLIAFMITASSAAWAGGPAQQRRSDDEERTLTSAELTHYAAAYHAKVRACYFEHGKRVKGATGEVALKIVVHRDGYVHDVAIEAPGIRGKALRKLDACVREEVLGWHFPVRRDFTTAILPYYFLYLDIPAAGPQYSCWNPKGCRAKPRRSFPNS